MNSIFLTLLVSGCGGGGQSSVVDEPNPILNVGDATVTEGNSAVFTVTLSRAADRDVTFDWIINSAGTATPTDDYTVTSGSVTIAEGDTNGTFTVTTIDDALSESTETFFVTIINPKNANLGDDQGQGTILDNDLGSLLSIDDVTVSENSIAVFTVSLSPVSGQNVSFDWSVVHGSTNAADFIASSGTGVTIPAGASTVTISVILNDDTLNETTENFNVVLSNPVNGAFADNVGIGTILDNDALPTLSINDVSVLEGNIATFTVSLNSTSGSDITFDWTTAGGTATSGVDFTASSGAAVTIPAGSSSVTVQVTTIDDFAYESAENFAVNLSNPTNATIADGSATGTINDNDSIPALSVTDLTVTEGGTASFTINLSIVSGTDVTFDYTTSNNSAIAGTDYTATSGTATILQGSTSTVITVNTTDDSLDESSEEFNLILSNPTAATISDTTGVATITDNDPLPSLSIDDVSLTEGGVATFTVSLNTASGRDVSFDWATSNGTALAGSDYIAGSGTLITIPAGSTSTTFNVITTDDSLDEALETFNAVISNPVNATVADATGVASLLDNDATPSLIINDVTVTENNNISFTVTLSAASGQAVTFDYASSNNTAIAGSDFTTTSGTGTITAGNLTTTILVPITDDSLDESTESFNMTISNPANATIADAIGVGTINDNDASPSLSIDSVSSTEGSNLVFTVTLSAVSGLDVSFDYASSPGTATSPADFSSTSGTGLTIPAGSTTTTIIVPTVDDSLDENSETMSMTISNPSAATITAAVGTGTLLDNDAEPGLSINDVSTTEGGNLLFTVSMSQVSGRDISFDWTTSNTTALSGSDYTAGSGTYTITAGSTSINIIITTLQNAAHEDSETLAVTISNPTGVTISDATGVGTILDDDTAPTLSINDVTVTEGTVAAFTVTLTGSTERTTTVEWSTANGTALAPTDYTSASNTLTFLAGETSKTINITTIDDAIDENSKAFTITLANPVNGTLSDASGTGTINDNDSPPTISIADTASAEGGTATFTISLSSASELNIDVDWATANNTALSGSDYTAASGTATILAGSTSTTVGVVTLVDGVSEAAETFYVNLSNPVNTTLADGQASGSITDINALPTLSINDISITEGSNAVFTVSLNTVSMQDVNFNWASSNGTALAGTDYVAGSANSITIPAGDLTTTVSVTTTDDTIDEIAENFNVTISAPVNATIADSTGVATLNDNDATPTLSVNDVSVTEGGTATFTVTLSAVSGLDATFDWTTSNDSAVSGTDYTATSGTTVTIPAGSTSTTFNVNTTDDVLDEPSETFNVVLSNPGNSSISDATGVATITDNDAVPSLTITDITIAEGDLAVATVSLNTLSGYNVTFDWATANGTALSGTDYTSTNGSGVTIPAGSLSTTINISTTDDAVDEISEYFYVNISNPTFASISDSQAQVNLTDNDPTPAISIDDVTITEGGTAIFTVSLSIVSGASITFDWTTNNNTALAGVDYTAASGTTATIPAGNSTYTMNVTSLDDSVNESPEQFQVVVSNASNATIADGLGIGTINDNDTVPTLSVNDVTVGEGGTAIFTVSLNIISGQDVTFDWTTANGSAVAPGDYTTNSGTTVTIPAGNLSTTLNVTTLDDALSESSEGFNINLSNPFGATLADASGLATITDNDPVPTLSISDVTVAESGTAIATVSLSAIAGQAIDFDWATANGTALSGLDYTTASNTETIPAGSLSTTVSVTLSDDSLDELDETFNINLSNPIHATVLDGQSVVTITDNDAPPTLSINSISATEASPLSFTVSLSAASGKNVTFDWVTSNGTALSGSDYTAGSGTGVTIPAGSTTTAINITTLADSLSESTETFNVTLSNPTDATIATAVGVGSILDDDAVPTLSINDVTIAEGGVATLTVTLSAAAGQNITFDYATSNNTALSGSDYTAATSSGTILAGSTTTTLNITTTDDGILETSETFNVILSNPSGATISDNTGIVTITDNDTPPTISINDVTVTEGTAASFTITISAASGLATSVDWATTNVTALSGTDYTAASGTAVIPAGSTTTTVNVTTLDDALDESVETFSVNLTSPTNGTLADAEGVATLNDNDATPTLSINSVTNAEGTVSAFTVTLSAVSGQNVSFDWATSNGTATAPGDYTGASASGATILAGNVSTTINITTIDDAIYESSETFNVVLSSLVNAGAGTLTGVATLTDNDTAPTLSINDISITEGSDAILTITQSAATEVNTTVNWATSNGTATQPSDYTLGSGAATITAGNTTTTVSITTIDDVTDENSETFDVTLSGPTGATLSDATGVVTLNDNDAEPNLSISDVSIAEGGVLSFTVSLSQVSQKNVTFDWATADNTAIAPGDYTTGSAAGATITAGNLSTTVTVTTLDDAVDENDESLFVNISNATNAVIIDSVGVGTITDNDASPTLSINDVAAAEGSPLGFTITLSAASQRTVTVDWATSNGTAVAPGDYTTASGTATINPGDTTATFNITTIDNTIYEGNETLTITLSNPTNATISDGTGIGTINENESVPTIAINDVSVVEGVVAGFTVTVTGDTDLNINFNYTTSNGTAIAPGDYTAATSSGTILAGNPSTTINITTLDDAIDEPDQNFTITLSGATNATISDATGIGTITDNDAPPTLSIDDVIVTEGTAAAPTVTLSSVSDYPVTFDWSTTNGTAVAPGDYTSQSVFGATIAAGSTTLVLNIPTIDDAVTELTENFTVNLASPNNATIADGSGGVTVNDNDLTPNITISDVTVAEGGAAILTVTLSSTSASAVTVDYATAPGTAIAGSDYTTASGTVVIAAGLTTETITITTLENTAHEISETFTVNLTNPVNGVITDSSGTVTITDNDAAPVLTISDTVVTEGTVATVIVTKTGDTEVNVEFDWVTTSGTALSGTDFTAGSGTAIVLTPATTTYNINVTTTDDVLNESTEAFDVVLSNPVNATIADTTGVITVNDNDALTSVTINDISVVEGAVAAFTITLNTVSGRPVSVDWTTADVTGTAPSDYTTVGGTATIPAGSTTATVNVTTINDVITCEIGETFEVHLSNPVDTSIVDATGIATISDNDPGISINDQTVTEGANASFTVTLSAACPGYDVEFNYTTANNTAIAGTDYTTASGTGSITAGNTTTTIIVPTTDDASPEIQKSFFVNLTTPVNGVITDAQGVGYINDNDTAPDISISDASIAEGGTLAFTVSLSTIASSNITMNYTTVDVTANAGTDYTTAAGVATITAGNLSTTINVATTGDTIYEPDETLNVNISGANLGAIIDSSGVGTITNNDPVPTLTVADISFSEGTSTATFTVTQSSQSSFNTSFDWATSNGTAIAGTDYTANSATGVLITAGNTTTTFDVTITDDSIRELNETFNVTISNPTNATIADATAVGTILDNEPALEISVADVTVTEGATAVMTISSNEVLGYNVTVDYTTIGGSATAGSDYTTTSGTATITAGTSSVTVNIPTTDDALDENSETFTFFLSNASSGTITDDTATVTVNDNDATPSLLIDDVTIGESGTATFTVTLSAVSGRNVTFDWTTSDVTATAGADYTFSSGSGVSINAGSTTRTINVPILTDTTDEIDETFHVVLSSPSNATIADNTGIGTITDDDAAPTLSISDTSAIEGNNLVFTITLSAISGKTILFDWATSNITATAGSDYTAVNTTDVAINPGNISRTITVSTTDDAVTEATETLQVDLTNIREASGVDTQAIGTITDNEVAPTISINDVTVAEGTMATLTITLSSTASSNINVDWATSDVTATGGSDYTVSSGTATVLAGNLTTTININTTNDNDYDGPSNETFQVTLSNPTIATISDGTGIVTLTDDEPIKLNATLTAGGDVKSFKISPDSSTIVYIADRDTDGVDELYSVNTDGTGHNKISGTMVAGGNVVDFKITADSNKVIYLADEDTNSSFELYSVNIGGGGYTKLNSNLAAGENILSFDITPDSSKVVYLSDESTLGEFLLYSVNVDGSSRTQISTTPVAGGDASSFVIAPNSNFVAYRGDMLVDNTYDLFTVELDGSNHTQVNSTLVAGGNVTDHNISANSSKVVYIADLNTDNDFELFSVNIDGSSHTQLNSAPVSGGDVLSFKITNNSSSVIYHGDITTDTVDELYSVNIGGGSHTKINSALVSGGDVISYQLAPDSSKVVYLADLNIDGANELFSVNINGSSHIQINDTFDSTRDVTSYAISANSTRIVYLSDEDSDDVFELKSITIAGASRTKISGAMPVGGDVQQFMISANSAVVSYVADQNTNNISELYQVGITGGGSTRINANLPVGGNVQTDFSTTPDSSILIYRVDQVTDELFELFAN